MTALFNISVLLAYVGLCYGAWYLVEAWSTRSMDAMFAKFE